MSDADFRVLSALAGVSDVATFSLKDLMASLGMDVTQRPVFYRALIRESREVERLVTELRDQLAISQRGNNQAQAKAAATEQEVKPLRTKVAGLEGENAQLKRFVSEAQDSQALKDFLAGQMDTATLKAVIDLLWDVHYAMQIARIRGQPAPNPAHLSAIRQQLRSHLMESLQIPSPKLELELQKANQDKEVLKEALKQVIARMTGGRA
jgi:predicted nuclease with TOPRIM domain